MRRPSRSGLSLVFALCVNIPLIAQNLESIGKEKPFAFSGGLSFNQIFYASSGIASRRDPYSYFASGSVNLSLYGWSVPLSFNVSDQNTSFSQPFNQYALHPSWKWITAHAGYTSMSFSPYTVSGHIFLGGGFEVAPEGKWKLSALYGRFLKAVERDTFNAAHVVPSFQRMGYGLKASYGTGRDFIDLILFRAADDERSVRPIPDSLNITPQQNLVLSVGAGKTLLRNFILKAELATSAITHDTRAAKTDHDHALANSGNLFQPRLSSAYYKAFKSSVDFQHDGYLVGLSYEWIDPEYRTLGAYYFNNDLENITLNSSAILANKLNIALSTGLQRDNLDKSKVSTMRRMVGSLNMQYTPSQKLNISISWSSFQTYTNIRSQFETINQLTPYENIDKLNFTQISRNATVSAMYTLPGPEKRRQVVSIHLSSQDAAEKQGQIRQHAGTSFYNLSTGYSLALLPRNMTLSISFNTAINEGPGMHTRMLGPNASISRSFFNRKFKTTFSSAYNRTYSRGAHLNAVFNCRVNGAVAIRGKHNLNLSAVIVNRTTKNAEHPDNSFTEFTGTLGYSYALGTRRE
jgi:hypothetical protein